MQHKISDLNSKYNVVVWSQYFKNKIVTEYFEIYNEKIKQELRRQLRIILALLVVCKMGLGQVEQHCTLRQHIGTCLYITDPIKLDVDLVARI